jgi:hypothetical protein
MFFNTKCMRFYNFMTKNMKFTEELIVKYLDEELSSTEAAAFELELTVNKSFAELFERHEAIHSSLSKSKVLSPSTNFTTRVMTTVGSLSFSSSNFFNRTRLYVLLLIIIALATTLYYLSMQFYPTMGNEISNELTMKDFTVNLQPAQQLLDSALLFKIVFYVNGLVCLLLLDRAILKPYFERRKQRYSM